MRTEQLTPGAGEGAGVETVAGGTIVTTKRTEHTRQRHMRRTAVQRRQEREYARLQQAEQSNRELSAAIRLWQIRNPGKDFTRHFAEILGEI